MSADARPACPEDAADLARLHAASFADAWDADYLKGWLVRSESFAVFVPGGDGSGLGALAFGLALASGADADLLTIASDPVARRSGLGRKILRALDAEAARRGLARWVLEVARNNLPALALYTSEGFVEIGVRKAYYPGADGPIDAIVMARPVG
jgi:[ribosomal protein S18]-alanine N-acetyltransferase